MDGSSYSRTRTPQCEVVHYCPWLAGVDVMNLLYSLCSQSSSLSAGADAALLSVVRHHGNRCSSRPTRAQTGMNVFRRRTFNVVVVEWLSQVSRHDHRGLRTVR